MSVEGGGGAGQVGHQVHVNLVAVVFEQLDGLLCVCGVVCMVMKCTHGYVGLHTHTHSLSLTLVVSV
jgi:hypothetical protein